MSYSRRSRYSPSPSPPHKRYGRSFSRSRSSSRGRSYDASDIENPGNNLYVTGLSPRITKRDLEKHFSAEGKVEDVHLVIDPWTRESRGFGFVSMSNINEAERCIKYLDGSVLEGRVITVEKARRRRGRTPTPGRYLGLRTVHASIPSALVPWASSQFVVDPQPTRLIRGVTLLVTHLKEKGAGHTLHIIVAGVADHILLITAVGGPTLDLAPLTVDHQLAGADLTAQRTVTTRLAGTVLGLTAQKNVTTGGAGTTLGLTAQKTVTAGGADTTRGIIHQTTEWLAGARGITHLNTGAGAGAGVIGLFLEVCLLPQGGTTGATLLA